MNSEYCAACGHKLYFESVKPKFCSKCGSPFNTFSVSKTPVKQSKARRFASDDDDDEVDDFDVSSLDRSKLGVERIETFYQKPVKLEQIAATNQSEGPIHRPVFRPQEGVSVLKLTEEECRSSKNNPIDLTE